MLPGKLSRNHCIQTVLEPFLNLKRPSHVFYHKAHKVLMEIKPVDPPSTPVSEDMSGILLSHITRNHWEQNWDGMQNLFLEKMIEDKLLFHLEGKYRQHYCISPLRIVYYFQTQEIIVSYWYWLEKAVKWISRTN